MRFGTDSFKLQENVIRIQKHQIHMCETMPRQFCQDFKPLVTQDRTARHNSQVKITFDVRLTGEE